MTAPLNRQQRAAIFKLITAQLGVTLARAMEERPLRPDLVTVDGQQECEWAVYELDVMHAEVNRLREGDGLPPVSREAITLVERQALGHSDYAAKFALYCAELCTPAA